MEHQLLEKNYPWKREIKEMYAKSGEMYSITTVMDLQSPLIEQIARLDLRVFPHSPLSADGFRDLLRADNILLCHINDEGNVISTASLILQSAQEATSRFERNLPDWMGYCDGAAVAEEYRGQGLQRQLLRVENEIARQHGKAVLSASVYPWNVASIRSLLGSGWFVVADAPTFYDNESASHMIITVNDLQSEGNPLRKLRCDDERLPRELQGITLRGDVQRRIEHGAGLITIGVKQGDPAHALDNFDADLNASIAAIIRSGYVGVSCHDIGERHTGENALIFVRTNSELFPEVLRQRLTTLQGITQALLDD